MPSYIWNKRTKALSRRRAPFRLSKNLFEAFLQFHNTAGKAKPVPMLGKHDFQRRWMIPFLNVLFGFFPAGKGAENGKAAGKLPDIGILWQLGSHRRV